VVTGATGGIGRWIALGLARAHYRVILIGRDPARAEAAQAWIAAQVLQANTELLIADLSLLASTRDVGERIASKYPKIALLINNAGIFEARRTVTCEGHERVLATNHLSPFVLTEMLLPALQAGEPARIVNIGSSTSDSASIDPARLALGAGWSMRRAYAQSKLALMMTTFAFAKRLQATSVTANVVHHGLVASGLVRSGGVIGLAWRGLALIALSEEQGADNALHGALAPE
jgi:NAD(P)-dependent dehydrogenase (short-subunit alcohol dehydrogenase family)